MDKSIVVVIVLGMELYEICLGAKPERSNMKADV